MRRLLTAGIVCAAIMLSGKAMAQSMPGQVVSNTTGEQFKLVGQDLPQVAKPVGKPINLPNNNPLFRKYNPNNPYEALDGTGLSVTSVVAPVNGNSSAVPPGAFQQFTEGMKAILGLTPPPTIQRIYTPGIYRRDRERVKERMWVRD